MREIMERTAANDLLANSFDRMAGHLRANGVDIDRGDGVVTLGPWLELDPDDRAVHQQRRGERAAGPQPTAQRFRGAEPGDRRGEDSRGCFVDNANRRYALFLSPYQLG